MSHLLTVLAAGSHEVGVVGDLVIVLSAAVVTALVMRRLGLAVIPAFLVAMSGSKLRAIWGAAFLGPFMA